MTIEELREEAKKNLIGYSERDIECYIMGALHSGAKITDKRSEEWYEKQRRRKESGEARSAEVCEYFKEVTGLGKSVENLKMIDSGEFTDMILQRLINALADDEEKRNEFFEGIETIAAHNRLLKKMKDGE